MSFLDGLFVPQRVFAEGEELPSRGAIDTPDGSIVAVDNPTTGRTELSVGPGGTGAPINSPTFTGTPTAPTAAPGTNTTQLATTAFVTAAIAAALEGVLEV